MAITNLTEARQALASGQPELLLEAAECVWLDAKRDAYRLERPAQAEELAKDVAGLLNSGIGGLLVLGVRTRDTEDGEILDHLSPFPREQFDGKQVRDVLKERVTPAPLGITAQWIARGPGIGVAYIDVPPPPPTDLPFVLAAPNGKNGKINPSTLAVPVRVADGTHWMPRTEIHRRLAVGWSGSAPTKPDPPGTPELPAAAVILPGDGLPERADDFLSAHGQLALQGLVDSPRGPVRQDNAGTGAYQHFEPSSGNRHGWVLAAAIGEPLVGLAIPVWNALLHVGRHGIGGDALSALGYPCPPASDEVALVDADATDVPLSGGSWGPGSLTRSADQPWRWSPKPHAHTRRTPGGYHWTSDHAPETLSIRAVATFPLATDTVARLDRRRRSALVADLPESPLAHRLWGLVWHRSVDASTGAWELGNHSNTDRAASYVSLVTDRDGKRWAEAHVMLALPDVDSPALVAGAEIRMQRGAAVWDARLTLLEVRNALVAAWETADLLLHRAHTDPPHYAWAGIPQVELQLSAQPPHHTDGSGAMIDDLVDLAAFGATIPGRLPRMSITLDVGPHLPSDEREMTVRKAMATMALAFGYIDVEARGL